MAPQETTIILDARKRLSLSKFFPDTNEVRVTTEGDRLIVEPLISLTPTELKAMRDPELLQRAQEIDAMETDPAGVPYEALRAKLG